MSTTPTQQPVPPRAVYWSFWVCLGATLPSVPLLEVLDVSWNVGVGGGGLQGLLGKVPPSLRELHVQACQLTTADAPLLGG